MKIDTLILSGGGVKGAAFMGSIKYLVENNIINFNNINKIYCVSAGALFIISLILVNYDLNILENDLYNYDILKLINLDDISLKNFIDNYGMINNNYIYKYIQEILINKYNCDSMSLLKFYKLFGKHIIIKVTNISNNKIEYIDHINNPKINILKLIQMTTSIPFLISPIKYKNNLYLDGGLTGNSISEMNKDDYLNIEIYNISKKMDNIFDFVSKIGKLHSPDYLVREYNKRNIKIICDNSAFNFKLNNQDKKKIFDEGYKQTKEHIINHQVHI